ncbi:MAG: ATP-binding protein [Candidatus Rokuibacteriota bacterium]
MHCPRCQAEAPPRAKFCPECGAGLPAACPMCGAALPAAAKFCPECGQRTSETPPAAARFSSPSAYTPRHLAEKILMSRESLEGERKHVTVLFADLKSSMELLADRDPRRLLDPILERMIDAVHRYDGTVNQVMGDGIMALFGAPLAHEDHAVRACYAGLRMQETVKRYAEELHRTVGVPVHIRVGLNSGEVVVRSIGSDLHMDYTAVGQTTHLAARMEQMAMPGSILATPDTLRLVEGYVTVKPLGPRPVKGLEAPLEVYAVTGAATARSRLHATAARGLSRFVGRDSEMEQLRQVLARVQGGHGHVVAVVGEAGVGKSRLFWEFTHSHRTEAWRILESTSVSYGRAASYLPVIELLRAYFRIEEHDDPRTVREKLTGKLVTLDESLKPVLPAVLTLLGAVMEDPQWDALDPSVRRQRTFDAVKRILVRESQIQPLLVVFEDLHWIDSETQTLLDSLVESLPTARMLLLVNYRPEYQHGWGSKTYYTQLRIDPLSKGSAAELLEILLGSDPALDPLRRVLIERTEGNPFFLEETVRTLAETGIITGVPGAFRLGRPVETVQVPATVQAVLAARIDRLPLPVKHLLQEAAVVGKDVPFGLLEAIAERTPDELRGGLAQLQAAEFLYEASLFPELEYTFKHALTLEVAYQTLLRERRRILHERVLGALEQRGSSQGPGHIELLAHHAVRGEMWEQAARYLYQAGEQALAQGRMKVGGSFYDAAIEALERLGERADPTFKLDAYLEAWVTRISNGQLEGLPQLGEKAEALARALGDGPRLAKVQVRQAQAMAVTGLIPGTFASAIEKAREAFARAASTDLRTRSYAQFIAGLCCRDLGRFQEAIGEFGEGIALFGSPGDSAEEPGLVFPIFVSLCCWRSEVQSAVGQLDAALASATEGLRMADEIRHASSMSIASAYLGYVHIGRGDLTAAVPMLERGLAIGHEHDLTQGIVANSLYLALAVALLGKADQGREHLQRALERRVGSFITQWTRYGTVTATAYLASGRPVEAREEIARGLALVAERDALGYEAPLRRLEAEVLLGAAPEGHPQAREQLEQALRLAQTLGTRPEAAHCHAALARAWAPDNRHRAAEHLSAATSIYRALGMEFWAARAEALGRP